MGKAARETGPETRALGLVFKILRKALGQSTKDVSETTDIPLSTITAIESGLHSPDYSRLLRIAEAFGVPLPDVVEAAAIRRDKPYDELAIAKISKRALELADESRAKREK